MTDLLHVLPDFPTKSYTHLLPSLERHHITTTDLLTLDALDIAKRARLPLLDLRRLAGHILSSLQDELGLEKSDHREYVAPEQASRPPAAQATLRTPGSDLVAQRPTISTLDRTLDEGIGGGIPTGYITEIVGESGAGKTQLLLTLLLSTQLPNPHGLSRPTLYLSTEGPLATTRLTQILATHPLLRGQNPSPSLSNVHSIQTPDLESQEHIITYQVPVIVDRENIGLVVIDSIAANYRAERSGSNAAAALAERSGQLARLGAQLRSLAREHNCAVVVANQVSDRFAPAPSILPPSTAKLHGQSSPYQPSSSLPRHHIQRVNPLNLDHQLRFFSGWGSDPASGVHSLKSPSLGLVWANQIACRVVLIKEICYGGPTCVRSLGGTSAIELVNWNSQSWRRWMKVAFAAWAECTADAGQGVEFEIWGGGLKAVNKQTLEPASEPSAIE